MNCHWKPLGLGVSICRTKLPLMPMSKQELPTMRRQMRLEPDRRVIPKLLQLTNPKQKDMKQELILTPDRLVFKTMVTTTKNDANVDCIR